MAPSLWLTLVHFQSVYEDSMSSGWHSFCSWVSLLVSWRSPLGFWLRSLDSVHLGSVDSNSGFYNLWMYPNSHLDSCFLGWLYSLVFWWSFVWGSCWLWCCWIKPLRTSRRFLFWPDTDSLTPQSLMQVTAVSIIHHMCSSKCVFTGMSLMETPECRVNSSRILWTLWLHCSLHAARSEWVRLWCFTVGRVRCSSHHWQGWSRTCTQVSGGLYICSLCIDLEIEI